MYNVNALSHVSSVVVICIAICVTCTEIHPRHEFLSYFTLLTTSGSRGKGKGEQLNPKVYSLHVAPVANLPLSSQPFIPFVANNLFVSNYFWWTSSFSSCKTVHHPTTCCFSISNATQPSDLPLARGSLTYSNPHLAATSLLLHGCCYIVAVTSLLLHRCCYIVAVTSLLLHPTKTHFLGPAIPTTPSHLIHSTNCNNLNWLLRSVGYLHLTWFTAGQHQV